MSDNDPFMELAAGAVAMKQLFDAYVAAGFTADQALKILVGLMTVQFTTPPST